MLAIEFKNEHLSVSRLKLYEACPRSFFYRYAGQDREKSNAAKHGAADFGKVLHAALEAVYVWILREEYAGAFPEEHLVAAYKSAWQESGLVELAVYQEGLAMLRAYARGRGEVDHFDILSAEQEFNIDVEGFTMNGYIDLVERVSDDRVRIVDYKSNRRLFTKDELANDLQFSIYGLAARELYPWAKSVEFEFRMLRFDVPQRTTRAASQIDDAAGYVVALGKRTETDQTWEPRLNENCGYCEHRARCDRYAEALTDGRAKIVRADPADIEDVAREREQVAAIAKAAYARKDELDKVIRRAVEERGGELHAADRCYTFQHPRSNTYDRRGVVQAFAMAGVPLERVERVLTVDAEAVENLRVELAAEMQRPDALLLKANLEAAQRREAMGSRLDSRASKVRR
jgi:hypothetical protein